MDSNETHGKFADILALATPAQKRICKALRVQIAALHKGRVEVVWPKHKIISFGVGPKKMTEHYAYIAIQDSHVNLGFYRGASLADPDGILEGSGKKLRHTKIHDLAVAKHPQITRILRRAIAEHQTK
jgi:hypothetical protein